MKKLAVSLILGATLVITPSVFALTKMSDSNMKSATAQAGVSIAIDNVKIESFTGSTTYTDDDGTGTGIGSAGSIVISNRHTLKTYNALPNDNQGTGGLPLYKMIFAGAVNAATGSTVLAADGSQTFGTIAVAKPLTIDVGACPIISLANRLNASGFVTAAADLAGGMSAYLTAQAVAAANTGTTAMYGVVIGLPTLMITTSADNYSIGVSSGATTSVNNGKNFITITKGASVMAILSGTVEIAAH